MTKEKRKWTPEQESIFIKYRKKIISRMCAGEKFPNGNCPDKPHGFIEWLKNHPGIKVGFSKHKEKGHVICWNCGTEYSIDCRKCPNPDCGKFNPDANKNK